MRVPDSGIGFDDLVRGQVTFDAEHVHDYVIVRANGDRSTRWSIRSTTR